MNVEESECDSEYHDFPQENDGLPSDEPKLTTSPIRNTVFYTPTSSTRRGDMPGVLRVIHDADEQVQWGLVQYYDPGMALTSSPAYC